MPSNERVPDCDDVNTQVPAFTAGKVGQHGKAREEVLALLGGETTAGRRWA